MTLNGVIALILLFSPNSIALLAKYVTVVKYRPIMSVNIVSQFHSSIYTGAALLKNNEAFAKLTTEGTFTSSSARLSSQSCYSRLDQ